jgi:GntR family transcriptional regulator
VDQGPRELTSFSEEMRRHRVLPSSRVLMSAVREADARIAEALAIAIGKPIFVLKRLRMANGEPMGVQTAHIPLDMVPGLETENLENSSLYQILQSRYNLLPARARETYLAIRATAPLAKLLGVTSGAAVFDVARVTFLPNGKPFEFVQSTIRGDRYSIILELAADRIPQAVRQDRTQ